MKRARLLDPSFKYVKAADTDVAKTFARVRREMKEQAAKPAPNVKPLTSAKTKPGGKT